MLDQDPDLGVDTGVLQSLRGEMADIASSAGGVESRAADLLSSLGEVIPLAAACVAVRNPDTRVHQVVGWAGSTEPIARYLERAEAEPEIEFLGLDRPGPPVYATALPVPLEQTLAWGEYLLPAGLVDGFAVSLYSSDGRQLGLAAFFTDVVPERMAAHGRLVDQVRPYFVRALDRLPGLAALAELSGDALGGVALSRAGETVPLPGLPGHPLLRTGSRLVTYVRGQLGAPGSRVSFLAPLGSELVSITALDCREPATDRLQSVVLVRPAGDLRGLPRYELQRLGALLEGWSEQRVSARFAQPTAMPYARIDRPAGEHATLLLIAGREGLYIPPALW